MESHHTGLGQVYGGEVATCGLDQQGMLFTAEGAKGSTGSQGGHSQPYHVCLLLLGAV